MVHSPWTMGASPRYTRIRTLRAVIEAPGRHVLPPILELRRPRLDEEDEVMRAHRATTPEVPRFLHHFQEGMSFQRYLAALEEHEHGADLPPDQVPSTF